MYIDMVYDRYQKMIMKALIDRGTPPKEYGHMLMQKHRRKKKKGGKYGR